MKIKDVYADLIDVRDWLRDVNGDETDVRLQYWEGMTRVLFGDAQYDTDHRGSWGAGSVSRADSNRTLMETARDLVSQVREAEATR